jgi:hypothetical protein
MTDSAPAIFVVAANEASCDDLQTIFGMRGSGFGCRCQRYKLRPRESFGNFPVEERAHRKRGVSRALAQAAVNFARERGALAVEGYPITTKDVILQELHVGTERMFAAAGFREVSRPTARRLVMRVDF